MNGSHTPLRIRWQWRVAYALAVVSLAIPVYALWPVQVTQFPTEPPVRVGPAVVPPGSTLQWVSVGVTCFPDGWVLVRQTVRTRLPDGSQFHYPSTGPLLNRRGVCVEDNLIAWEMPTNLVIPGPFIVEFQFCTNPDQLLRERCSTRLSPQYVLQSEFHPTVNGKEHQ